jgi:excisionase family DNA binding protein
MEKTTMSVQELAIQLGVSIPKAYEITKAPGFPSIRIGSRIIIPIEEYKKWLMESSKSKEGESDETV